MVNDQGSIGKESQIVKVYTNNKKNNELLEDVVFLIRDNDRANTNNILRLIPLTTWYDQEGFHSIPYQVYYYSDPTETLTSRDIKKMMEDYGKTHLYVFDDENIPCPSQCVEEPIHPATTCCEFDWGKLTIVYDMDDVYFDFWDIYEYVVLVERVVFGREGQSLELAKDTSPRRRPIF